MFDLNKAVGEWRRRMKSSSGAGPSALTELESHLRDQVDRLLAEGLETEQAFERARELLGDPDRLKEDFAKVDEPALESIKGATAALALPHSRYQDHLVVLLLWIGFSSVIAYLATIPIFGLVNPLSAFYVALAGGSLFCGFRVLSKSPSKKRLVLRSLVPTFLLSPATIVLGVVFAFSIPLTFGWVSFALGNSIVMSETSPDGKYELLVRDEPSIDGPNHSVSLRYTNGERFGMIEDLPEDVDAVQEILWSPLSDLVVARTRELLIITRAEDFKTVKIHLRHGWKRRPNGLISPTPTLRKITETDFPRAGAFTYRREGGDKLFTVEF